MIISNIRKVGIIFITLVIFLAKVIVFLLYENHINNLKIWNELLEQITFPAIVALIALHFTLDNNKRSLTDKTLELFKLFTEKEFYKIRSKAWLIRQQWCQKESYREKVVSLYLPQDEEDALKSRFSPNECDEHRAIQNILEFFSVLSIHPGDEKQIQSLDFYYTSWWRGFLLEIRQAYLDRYIDLGLCDEQIKQFRHPVWVYQLVVLENRLKLPKYDKKNHPIDLLLPDTKIEINSDFLKKDWEKRVYERIKIKRLL